MTQPGDPYESTDSEVEREAAAAFEHLWASAPELDDAALRARVDAAVAATPQRSAWWRGGAGRIFAPGLRLPRLTTALGAAAAIVLAAVAVLATQGGSSQAAVLEEVEALSNLATQALADEMLSAEEREAIRLRAVSLAHLLEQDPDALAELDDDDVTHVVSTLEALLATIHGHVDDEPGSSSTFDLIDDVSSQARHEQAQRATDDDDDRDGDDDDDANSNDEDDHDVDDNDDANSDDEDDRDVDENDGANSDDADDRDVDVDDNDDDDGDDDDRDDDRDDHDGDDGDDKDGDDEDDD